MPKEKPKVKVENDQPDPDVNPAAETETSDQPVTVRVTREHILTAHSVELRRNGGDRVIEARTADHAHSETIGAKTVAAIVEEHGATALLDDSKAEINITFSPYTGEIVSIEPVEKTEEPDAEKEKSGDDAGDGDGQQQEEKTE